MSVIKYQRALAAVGGLLRNMRLKDLKHRRKDGSLPVGEARTLAAEVKRSGGVLTSADLGTLSVRFTADAREAISSGRYDAPGAWDE